jgi:hypothetical protein
MKSAGDRGVCLNHTDCVEVVTNVVIVDSPSESISAQLLFFLAVVFSWQVGWGR